jgi:hypothetical protein
MLKTIGADDAMESSSLAGEFLTNDNTVAPNSPTFFSMETLAVRQWCTNSLCNMTSDAQARVLQPVPATVPALQNTCFFANPDSSF